ncbi:MAG: hypothetical protein H7Y17_04000 [Chlorobia bacterium]|nr:hypothetical protein [Fimbriimonadaceae bacterium]
MKKRKPPIVLATCLVIMLLAVGIIYGQRPKGDDGHGHGQEAPPPPAAEQGERPTMSPSQITSMNKGMMKPGKAQPGRPGMEGAPTGPSIAVPKQQTYKPTPNDSSTSTQWYTDQTKK